MEKEFNLSDEECYDATGRFYYYKGISIKEFIKIIREGVCLDKGWCGTEDGIEPKCKNCRFVDKESGPKLITKS